MKSIRKFKLNGIYFICCIIILASSGKSQATPQDCDPVKVIKNGFLLNNFGEVVVIPDSNMSIYEVVLEKCPSSKSDWSTRTYYRHADSIIFDKHRYWCVIFIDGGKDFETVRRLIPFAPVPPYLVSTKRCGRAFPTIC